MIKFSNIFKRFMFDYFNALDEISIEFFTLEFKNTYGDKIVNQLIQELEKIIEKSETDGAWGYHMHQACGESRNEKTESFIRTLYEELRKPFVRKDLWIIFLEEYLSKYCKLNLEQKIYNYLYDITQKEKMKMISILQTIVNTENYEHTTTLLKEVTGISITPDEMKELVIESLRLFRA